MRSDQVAKGFVIQVLKTSEDRDGTTCLGSLLCWPGCPHGEKIHTEQGWERCPVASSLAAVVSGSRIEAEREIFFSCSVLLLGLSVRKLSLKHRLASRWAGEGRGGLYGRKE